MKKGVRPMDVPMNRMRRRRRASPVACETFGKRVRKNHEIAAELSRFSVVLMA